MTPVSLAHKSVYHSLSSKNSTEECPMYSGIVGAVKLDDALLEREIAKILQVGHVKRSTPSIASVPGKTTSSGMELEDR